MQAGAEGMNQYSGSEGPSDETTQTSWKKIKHKISLHSADPGEGGSGGGGGEEEVGGQCKS